MNLFEHMKYYGLSCVDTCDLTIDAIITVTLGEEAEPEDEHDRFCHAICKLVDVAESDDPEDVWCHWSELIEEHIGLFRSFAEKYWVKTNRDVSDDDDLIEEWLEQISSYLSGNGTDEDYSLIMEEIIDKIPESSDGSSENWWISLIELSRCTVSMTGCTDGVSIDPCTCQVYVDFRKAHNWPQVDAIEGVNHLCIRRTEDGQMHIFQASGYTPERGLFVETL